MHYLELTLDTPEENLALDEALLEAAEAAELAAPVIRLWESPNDVVVLGRSSRPDQEVRLDACRREGVAVLRRPSGGGTIVAGAGCLMYALVLSLRQLPQLRAIDQAHRFVLETMADGLRELAPKIIPAGISDLAFRPTDGQLLRKFSGNALRIKRDHLLYHGTLLYDFDLSKIGRWLVAPPREPDYRNRRAHADFVGNLAVPRKQLADALLRGWEAHQPLETWPRQRTTQIAKMRYGHLDNWLVLKATT